MLTISENSRAMAWLRTVEQLSARPELEVFHTVVEITEPMRTNDQDQLIEHAVDSFLRQVGVAPLHTVAETIFPAWEYRRAGTKGVYEVYPNEVYPRIKERWGTYAHRLLRRDLPDGSQTNPLQVCIEKMRSELSLQTTKSACYEISLSEGIVDLPLYSVTKDQDSRIGGPCLSHLSFKITRERKLLMTALYRSHYYITKALGNFLGLARLMKFICDQTGLEPGPLLCVSTLAKLELASTEGRWSQKQVASLIESARGTHFRPASELRG